MKKLLALLLILTGLASTIPGCSKSSSTAAATPAPVTGIAMPAKVAVVTAN